jgi:hypothetical protein
MKFNPLQDQVLRPNYQHAELPVHFSQRGGEPEGVDAIRHQVRNALIELSVPDIDFFKGSNETFNPVRQIVAGRLGRVVDAFTKSLDKHYRPRITDTAFLLDYDSPKLEVNDCLELVETQIHSAIYSMYHIE